VRIKLLFLVVALLVGLPAFAQKPSIEKCRADARDLYATVNTESSSPKVQKSYFYWSSHADEMSQCQDVDVVIKGNKESVDRGIMYMGLENIARAAMVEELNNFIHRHGLEKQFVDDDEAGLR
jgi:hypothetical protein